MSPSPTAKPKPPPPPPLNIPDSDSVVDVHIINSTSRIKDIPFSAFVTPDYKDLKHLDVPALSFLIQHRRSGRKILFDLGVRRDWEKLPPSIVERIMDGGWSVTVEKGVADILREGGVALGDIEGIIWSHHHWDHTGDPSTFPASTDLIVGPGFKASFLPGYPDDPTSPVSKSAYEGRNLREVSFAQEPKLVLGRCDALDFFGDGSFYLLDTPGHAVGHMCGLARTTAASSSSSSSPENEKGGEEEATFIFLGGDCAHHGGEFRPTPYLPLPDSLSPSPLPRTYPNVCPGAALFADIHRLHPSLSCTTEPFFLPAESSAAHHDVAAARDSIAKMAEFDANENVLTILAHDQAMLDVVGAGMFLGKQRANGWKGWGWRERGLWKFLGDLEGAVEKREEEGNERG